MLNSLGIDKAKNVTKYTCDACGHLIDIKHVQDKTSVSPPVPKGLLYSLRLLLFKNVKAYEKDGLTYYHFECKTHGRVIGYRHGYDQLLECPACAST